MIICCVLILCALPVLPTQFADIAALFSPQHGTNQRDNDKASRETRPPTPPTPADSSIAQVRLLEIACQELLTQISASPGDPSLQNRIGLVYLGLGETDTAHEHFQRAVELARIGLAGAKERARSLQSQGDTGQASACMVECSRLNVELSAAHGNLARLYERMGQHGKVLAELDLLNREGVITEPPAIAKPGAAVANARQISPVVGRLLYQAEMLMQSQQFNEAVRTLKNVISMDPNVADAHRDLGVLNAVMADNQGAIEELRTAIRLQPNDALSHNNLGMALQTQGKLPEAKQQFEQAIAANPKLVDASINLGNLYASADCYDAASQVLQRAVTNNPRSAIAHNNLGTVFSLKGSNTEAIDEFRKALSIQPDMACAHYGLGNALMKANNYRAAVGELKQALLLNPGMASARDKIEQAMRRASMVTN